MVASEGSSAHVRLVADGKRPAASDPSPDSIPENEFGQRINRLLGGDLFSAASNSPTTIDAHSSHSHDEKKRRRESPTFSSSRETAATALAHRDAVVRKVLASMANAWGANNPCGHFQRGFFSGLLPTLSCRLWLLRHWAVLATVRGSAGLLTCTKTLAAAWDLSLVHDVVDGITASMPAAGQPPPRAVRQVVDGFGPGFGFARSANPSADGTIDLYVNEAFETRVCSLDVLRQRWQHNVSDMLELFIHYDDLAVLPYETGCHLAQVAGDLVSGSGALGSPSSSAGGSLPHYAQSLVRVRIDEAWTPCQLVIHACANEAGAIYFAFLMRPLTMPGAALSAAASGVAPHHLATPVAMTAHPPPIAMASYAFPTGIPPANAAMPMPICAAIPIARRTPEAALSSSSTAPSSSGSARGSPHSVSPPPGDALVPHPPPASEAPPASDDPLLFGSTVVTMAEIEALLWDMDGDGASSSLDGHPPSWDHNSVSPPTSPPEGGAWLHKPRPLADMLAVVRERRRIASNTQAAAMISCSVVALLAVLVANEPSFIWAHGVLSIYLDGAQRARSSVSSLYGTVVALAVLSLVVAFRVGLLSMRVFTRLWAVVLPAMPHVLSLLLLCSDEPEAHAARILVSIERGVSVTFVPLVTGTLGAIHATMPRSTTWAHRVGALYIAGVVANTLVILAISARSALVEAEVGGNMWANALRLLISRCFFFAAAFAGTRRLLPPAKDVTAEQHVGSAS